MISALWHSLSHGLGHYREAAVLAAAYRIRSVSQRWDAAVMARAHDIFYESGIGGHTRWLGVTTVKNPLDAWVFQEIIWETKPELIVETGTFNGGGAFFHASILDLIGSGEVVSVEIDPVSDEYPCHPRITYLGGRSSTDPEVVAEVRERAEGKRTMVLLDSDHSQAHVEAEIEAYAPLVAVGCYLVVEDSNIGQIKKELVPGPLEAIGAFLGRTREFEVDSSREKFLITFNPRGYLRRVAPPGGQ